MKKRDLPPVSRSLLGHALMPWLVAISGVLITLAVFWKARADAMERFRTAFEGDASLRANILVDAFADRLMDLDALRRFYQSSTDVNQEEFREFVGPVPKARAGARAMAWVPFVRHAVRETFATNLTNFSINERTAQGRLIPAGVREFYCPIQSVEPMAGNAGVLGLDLGKEPACLAALTKARDTGQPVATERLLLPQDTGEEEGLIIFTPVFPPDQKVETPEQRRSAIKGFAVGMYRVAEVFTNAIAPTPQLGLPMSLLDLSAPPEKRLIYHWKSRREQAGQPGEISDLASYTNRCPFAGREWMLEVIPGMDYRRTRLSQGYWSVLPLGLLMAALLGFYLRALIAHRERAEQLVHERTRALHEREATLETITNSARDAIMMMDPDGRISFWNPAAERILDCPQESALGKRLQDLLAPLTTAESKGRIEQTLRGITHGKAIEDTLELSLQTRDARVISAELSLSPVLHDGRGDAVGILRDVTQRKRAEERLAGAERQYHELVNNLTVGVYRNTPGEHGRFLEANPAIVAMFEAGTKEEFLHCKVSDLYVDPVRRKEFSDKISREGFVRNEEIESKTLKGRRFWAEVSATRKTDAEGRTYFDGIIEDITDRKRAEELLQRERILLRTLIDHLPDAIYVKDAQCRKTVANRADVRNMGLQSEAEVLGKDDLELFPREAAERFMVDDREVLQTGRPVINREEDFIDKQGQRRWLLTSKVPLRDERGQIVGLVGVGHDITERRRAEERLRLLSRAVEQSPASIIITDPQGCIEYVNPKFTEVSGYTLEEARGKTPRILKSDLMAPAVYVRLWQTITAGRVWQGEFCNQRKNGTLFWEAASISPVTDAAGTVTHFVGVKEDITEMKRAEDELRQAKEAAEAASRAKSEFLANMSHEIRTPMNGVIGMTGLLLDTELAAEQREYAETIRHSGETLLALINDILDFSKIEAGKLDLELLDFDLRAVVEDTAEILALRAQQKGLEFICLIDPQVPELLQGDPGRLRQILTNLAGNAIKFTAQGEVSIHVSLEAVVAGKITLRFDVEDTGIGIPHAQIDRLFSPFTQVESSTTRRFGGTGLGLSISKRLVELMGGSIGVESCEGRGSTFWFKAVFDQPSATHYAPRPATGLAGKRVLVVDDNTTNRRLVTALLGAWGCDFVEAADGPAALERLRAARQDGKPFDLALLDMHMPEMDGEELGRQIKADAKWADLPLVMLTSLGERGHAERLRQIGFAGCLTKPLKQAQLYQCLALVLGHQTALPEQATRRFVTGQSLPQTGTRRFRILLAEDNATNQKVALTLLEKMGYRADAVANGREVIRALETIPYALVLMDCQMPEMDGYEATRVIRDPTSRVREHHLPVIAMTAYAMQGDREKCLAAGMNDYISKPVQPGELAGALARWLTADGTAQSPAAVAPAVKAGGTPDVFDEADLLRRLMGDEEVARSIIRVFVEESTRNIAELQNALERSDSESAAHLAHSLKGSSANLGARALRNVAAELEKHLKSGAVAEATRLLPQLAEQFAALKQGLARFLSDGDPAEG